MKTLIEAKKIYFEYRVKTKLLPVIQNVSFTIEEGTTLGLVGESGSGKSTIAKLLVGLYKPSSGEIAYSLDKREIQLVFQDPYSSLDPRMTVEEIVLEPLNVYKIEGDREGRIRELLALVGLDESFMGRYPFELSGGQRQRLAIARALAPNPKFLILDEPIAALDVSIQAQILNLLKHLQKRLNLTYLFISHDLAVVKYFSTKVAVMYHGQIVEEASSEELYKNPLHPYTKALFASIPSPKNKHPLPILHGETPSFFDKIQGCSFASRCPHAQEACRLLAPPETKLPHRVSCHLHAYAPKAPEPDLQPTP